MILEEAYDLFGKHLEKCFTIVERQFNKKIKCLRSDNTFELGMESQEGAFLSDHEILYQSCVSTSQQNGW